MTRVGPAFVVACALSACGGKAKGAGTVDDAPDTPRDPAGRTAAPLMPAPAGFAEANAVSIDGGALVTWSFAGDKVTRLGAIELPPIATDHPMAAIGGEWADREHFFVHVPPRTVLQVTAAGVTPITVPPASAFTTPRPDIEDEGLTEGGLMEGDRYGLVVVEDAAFWSECPWGLPYDGWQCQVYVTARLWPTTERFVDGDGIRPRRWRWPGATASGFRTKELDEGRVLGCTPPAGTAYKQTRLPGKEDDGEVVDTVEWVATSPPRMLVVWGAFGLDDLIPTRWALHDGCNEKPIVEGEHVEPGPGGLWLADDVVYRGGATLGPIAGYVRFRPI